MMVVGWCCNCGFGFLDYQQFVDVLNWCCVQVVVDFVVDCDVCVVFVVEYVDFDQLVCIEVYFDFFQYGVGQFFGVDQYDGFECMGLGVQCGVFGGRK